MNSGLYVYRPSRNYGLVRVEVDGNASGGGGMGPLEGVHVVVTTGGDSLITLKDGIVQLAPDPGAHTILARKFGYKDAAADVFVTKGGRQTVSLHLSVKSIGSFDGFVSNSVTHAVLPEAEVDLAYTPIHDHTDSLGFFHLVDVPADLYRVEVRRPGSIPLVDEHRIDSGFAVQNYQLTPAQTWDPLATDNGWTVGGPGDDAPRGIWTRTEPFGTSVGPTEPALTAASRPLPAIASEASPRRPERLSVQHEGGVEGETYTPGQVQPEYDRSPAPDSLCFVTGQGSHPFNITEADVDAGRTSLTSPALDMTGMLVPTIGYWRWFYAEFSAPDDWLAVLISNDNGVTWFPVDTTRGMHNHWQERSVRVSDYVAPTNQVRLRFVAADLGIPSTVEAAIDDITTYDAAPPVVDAPNPGIPVTLAFHSRWPNPMRGGARMILDVPANALVNVEVLDVAGRRVRTLYHGTAPAGPLALAWDGHGESGAPVPAGIYYARATTGGQSAQTRLVSLR